MSKSEKLKTLSSEQLATLFTQLKSMERAGIPAFQVLEIVQKSESALKQPLKLMQGYLSSGKPISEAGYKAGVFNSTHRTLIQAAEGSGTLTAIYGQLADYYSGLSSRIKKVKSRLYLPVLVLIISLFVQPVPALVKSEISGIDYLLMSVGKLTVIGIGVYFLIKLPRILQSIGLGNVYDRFLILLPVVSAWIIKRQINEFYFILAVMLEAGVAFAEALPKAVATIKNPCLRECFKPATTALGCGDSATETLSKVSVLNQSTLQFIKSSEHSGQLASGLLRFTQLEAVNISLQDEALAEWLPRLVYVLICIWMAYSIVGSQFTTVIPSDL
jgi:general secretion pathway protein F